ncbi:5-formyltetrahydrofolate cyclo-ligase [Halomicronema hongdechloris C2206]|uniref:5-formyltetrahydrofolate cyclo-ligase n=1 Tax=Halomicronema hongdechloris C2206 TaxID=1641165 RepID=A0A1Z3HTA3_9CYAN|nr:5-formyltetrahydrofolate cyclo-ligase [Halomicronema hongdechloris]ASC73561.1 5-formyltetrahydrofolate cyclo-ligase [Halomicronema hongdechloris C2206]
MTAESTSQNAIQTAKADLRRRLLNARQAIPPPLWRQKSDRICQHLQSWPYFHQARVVLSYCSIRQEPDLSPLFQHQRPLGLPRCVGREMAWHYWSPTSMPLQRGTYGIPEPHPQLPPVDPALVDLILVPAVACDARGYRLGYGGGYYDRMLSTPPWHTVPTIGIVFEYARLPSLPKNAWDKPLYGVCSESGLFLKD